MVDSIKGQHSLAASLRSSKSGSGIMSDWRRCCLYHLASVKRRCFQCSTPCSLTYVVLPVDCCHKEGHRMRPSIGYVLCRCSGTHGCDQLPVLQDACGKEIILRYTKTTQVSLYLTRLLYNATSTMHTEYMWICLACIYKPGTFLSLFIDEIFIFREVKKIDKLYCLLDWELRFVTGYNFTTMYTFCSMLFI